MAQQARSTLAGACSTLAGACYTSGGARCTLADASCTLAGYLHVILKAEEKPVMLRALPLHLPPRFQRTQKLSAKPRTI
eukprot:556529-Rhodomonas_salina.3